MVKTVYKNLTDVTPIADFDLITSALIRENNLPINSREDFERLFPDQVEYCSTLEDFCEKWMQPLTGTKEFVEIMNKHPKTDRVCIFADYDCDGVCAASILQYTFSVLGYRTVVSVPDRLSGHYGIDLNSKKYLRNPAAVYITVDTGISEKDSIKSVKATNPASDIIITDHHLPTEGCVPDAEDVNVIIDPKYTNDESSDICGAFVAFKLAYALLKDRGCTIPNSLLALAGIATVADMMPLLGENRQLVNLTLDIINTARDMHAPAQDPVYHIINGLGGYNFMNSEDYATEDLIGYYIAPSINAVSRVNGTVDQLIADIVGVMLSPSTYCMANYVSANITRREETDNLYKDFEANYVQNTQPCVVYLFEQTKFAFQIKGICGLIANKVSNKYKKVALFGGNNRSAEAGDPNYMVDFSARSVPGYNIHDGIERIKAAHPEFEISGGGHALAMGIRVRKLYLQYFTDALAEDIEKYSEDIEDVIYNYDPNYEDQIINGLGQLAPFGTGFKKIKFSYTGMFKGYSVPDHKADIGNYVFNVYYKYAEATAMKGQNVTVTFSVNYNDSNGPVFNILRG